jgi:cation-transporting ATPase E
VEPGRGAPRGPAPGGQDGTADAGGPGLTEDEVRRRRAAGAANEVSETTSRRLADIVRANVLTRFNAILGALLAVILIVGPLQDALFGIVLVTNTLIGIVQELRAKRSLDHLALLTAPRARVVRSGRVDERPVDEVVLDDLLVVEPGDQIVVDGVVVAGDHLEVDESLLTGESEPVVKRPGEEVLSGSFVVAGTGRYQATRVGRDAYARRLASEARAFQLVRSELRIGINRILRVVTWVLAPVALLLVWSQVASHESIPEAVRGSVAGVGSMIPEGLVLLTSVAFAAGVIRLARRRVLVQDLGAIEVLARVDVVCIDKTGTLTENELVVTAVEPVATEGGGGTVPGDALAALAALAGTGPGTNATMRAIARIETASPAAADTEVHEVVPFSSARKWSAADFGPRGAWVLGAPDVVLATGRFAGIAPRVEALTTGGAGVVLLSRSPSGVRGVLLPRDL